MPKPRNPKVTLYPPKVEVSKKSDKYDLYLDIVWGDFEKEVKLSKETFNLQERTIQVINETFLEASETNKPYIIYD